MTTLQAATNVTPNVVRADTRSTILDAAERLFAEEGIGATSIRTIIAAAAVNSAAVHYHFGSKEQLITDVFQRRASLITSERLRLLQAIPANATPAAKLEAIVRAFLKPGLFGADKSRLIAQRYAMFRARLVAENTALARELMSKGFDDSCRQFVTALGEVTPAFSTRDLHWRMHAMLGLLVYTMTRSNRIVSITHGACDPTDDDAALEELVKITVDIFRPGLAVPADGLTAKVAEGIISVPVGN